MFYIEHSQTQAVKELDSSDLKTGRVVRDVVWDLGVG